MDVLRALQEYQLKKEAGLFDWLARASSRLWSGLKSVYQPSTPHLDPLAGRPSVTTVPTPQSSNIAAVGYDNKTKTLETHFRGGGRYQYYPVNPGVYHRFKNAQSLGKHFHRNIRNNPNYTTVRLDTVSPDSVHLVAEKHNIPWDGHKGFMAETEKLTGKRHLDNLTAPELRKVMRHIEGGAFNHLKKTAHKTLP